MENINLLNRMLFVGFTHDEAQKLYRQYKQSKSLDELEDYIVAKEYLYYSEKGEGYCELLHQSTR